MLHHRLRRVRQARPQFVGGVAAVANATATTPDGAISASLTALTGGIAAAAAEGDVVLVAIAARTASGSANTTAMTTTGYTALASLYAQDAGRTVLSVFWKRLGASPDATVAGYTSLDGDYRVMAVQVWRGISAATPFDVTTATATAINAGVPDPPSITPATPGAIIVAVGAAAGAATGGNYVVALTAPAGMDRLVGGLSVAGADGYMAAGLAAYNWVGGAYDPAAFGGGNASSYNSWAAVTLALRPA